MNQFCSLILLLLAGLFCVQVMDASREGLDNDKQEDLVILSGASDECIIGDKISLKGSVDPSLFGTAPSDVIVLISAPPDSHTDSFMLAKTASNGTYHHSQVADVGGDWTFEALYSGIYSNKVTIAVIPGDEPKKTALTLSGWPTFPKIGEMVTFKGRLTDSEGKGIPFKPVTYRLASSPVGCIGGCSFGSFLEWRDAGIVTTELNGEYIFSLPVVESGGVLIETVFPGDDGYRSSSSNTLKITIYE